VTAVPLNVADPVPAKLKVVFAAFEVSVVVADIEMLPALLVAIVRGVATKVIVVPAVRDIVLLEVDAFEMLAPIEIFPDETKEIFPAVVEFVIAALIVIGDVAPFVEVTVRVFVFVPVQVKAVAKVIAPVPALPLVELMFTELVVKLPKSPVAGLTVPTLILDAAAVNE
jgi:hypothetical protein